MFIREIRVPSTSLEYLSATLDERKPTTAFVVVNDRHEQVALLDNVVPLLNRGKVDLLLCGHTHRYAIRPAGQNGLSFPMIIGGAETVIRCDVTPDQIRVTATDLSGRSLPQLPPITVAR